MSSTNRGAQHHLHCSCVDCTHLPDGRVRSPNTDPGYTDRQVTARKLHTCDLCGLDITPGSMATTTTSRSKEDAWRQ